jgi:hypothetical protein
MQGEPQLFENVDWNQVRDLLDRHPECSAGLNNLMDEMHHYEQAAFAIRRGQKVTLPERPDLTIRLNKIVPKVMTESSPI